MALGLQQEIHIFESNLHIIVVSPNINLSNCTMPIKLFLIIYKTVTDKTQGVLNFSFQLIYMIYHNRLCPISYIISNMSNGVS